MFRVWTCICVTVSEIALKVKFLNCSHMIKSDQIFFKPSFRETIQKGALELVYFYDFNWKMFIHVLTLISELFVIQRWKLNESWNNYQNPIKERKNAFKEKVIGFIGFYVFLKKLSVAVLVQWKHSGSCCIRLTLDGFGGHHFSKGQILKNVANCLKRMQNYKNLVNST